MQLRKAIQEIASKNNVLSRDKKTIELLLKKQVWTKTHSKEAEMLAKKYISGIEKENKTRRAVLRENLIYLNHDIKGSELEKLLRIPGRVVEPFSVPCNHYSIGVLREMDFKFSENLKQWEEQNKIKEVTQIESAAPGLKLFPYQEEGVKRLIELNGRALLADAPGIGKTAQVATYIALHPEITPVIILCPSGLKLNWQKELRMWGVKQEITIINTKKDIIPRTGITIMSYNMIYNFFTEIDDLQYKLLVCDESHALIHATSQRTKATRYLGRSIDKVILISGTPLTSRPLNLFVQLNLLDSQMFSSREKFINRYCNGISDPSGKGVSRSNELHKILTESFMIRRLKEDVLKDLPPKLYSVVPVEMSEDFRKDYKMAQDSIVAYIKQNYGDEAARRAMFGEVMVRMEHLKQIAAKSKINCAIEYIENIIESDEKVVVFATHKFMIETITERFGNIALKIDGSLSTKKKQENVEKFQNDKNYKVMVCNVQAGGVGITLTASSNVVFLEYPWTPGELSQAIDRCHRIGSVAECINVHYLVTLNTIDEDICSILDKKARVLADILDGGEIDQNVLLNQLINKFRNM